MSAHQATITWKSDGSDFGYKTYSRSHTWTFENGHTVQASAAVDYLGTPDRVDPEQAFVASLSSCHMLTFLAFCALGKKEVLSYTDQATGTLGKGKNGKMVITQVLLRPEIEWAEGARPTREELEELHEKAHHECFLANSVTCEIHTEIIG